MFEGLARSFWSTKFKWIAVGMTFAFAMALSERGGAVTFGQRTTNGVFGTMTISGTLAATIDLTVDSVLSTSAAPDAGALTAVTLTQTTLLNDTVNFGAVSATCAASTNGACYRVTGPVAAHYVATLSAHLVSGGFSGAGVPGLRICRSAYVAGQWPAANLRFNAGNGGVWTGNPANTVIGDIDTGSCVTNGNTVIASGGAADQTQVFQIAGRVDAADTTSPSSTITFESF